MAEVLPEGLRRVEVVLVQGEPDRGVRSERVGEPDLDDVVLPRPYREHGAPVADRRVNARPCIRTAGLRCEIDVDDPPDGRVELDHVDLKREHARAHEPDPEEHAQARTGIVHGGRPYAGATRSGQT